MTILNSDGNLTSIGSSSDHTKWRDMDIEFLRKNLEGDDPHIKFVRSDILLQTASEEDLKYIESYYKRLYKMKLTDAMNMMLEDWIDINDDLELGWRFDYYRLFDN